MKIRTAVDAHDLRLSVDDQSALCRKALMSIIIVMYHPETRLYVSNYDAVAIRALSFVLC